MTPTTQHDPSSGSPDLAAPHHLPPAAPPRGSLRTTAIVATVAVAIALLGLGLMLRPVQSPVQDCGTALAFLLDGRTDVFVDPADPPPGLTAEEVQASNERPCRPRALDTARPGAIAFFGGVLVATAAALTEAGIRTWRWYRRTATMPDSTH